MNIILFTNKRGQVWNFELDLLRFGITAVTGLVILIAVAVYTGTRIAEDELQHVVKWQGMVEGQQAEIAEARRSAQADIDALTLRIGKMQAQMLRLTPAFLYLLGPVYLVSALALNGVFLWQAVDIWRKPTNGNIWRLYKFSLLYLALLFLAMGVDRLFYTPPQALIDIAISLPF